MGTSRNDNLGGIGGLALLNGLVIDVRNTFLNVSAPPPPELYRTQSCPVPDRDPETQDTPAGCADDRPSSPGSCPTPDPSDLTSQIGWAAERPVDECWPSVAGATWEFDMHPQSHEPDPEFQMHHGMQLQEPMQPEFLLMHHEIQAQSDSQQMHYGMQPQIQHMQFGMQPLWQEVPAMPEYAMPAVVPMYGVAPLPLAQEVSFHGEYEHTLARDYDFMGAPAQVSMGTPTDMAQMYPGAIALPPLLDQVAPGRERGRERKEGGAPPVKHEQDNKAASSTVFKAFVGGLRA